MSEFDVLRKLQQLCRRHGLPDAAGGRFVPLLERTARERPDLLQRVVEFVDRQLAAAAAERARARRMEALRDEACLKAVAPLLHGWKSERGA